MVCWSGEAGWLCLQVSASAQASRPLSQILDLSHDPSPTNSPPLHNTPTTHLARSPPRACCSQEAAHTSGPPSTQSPSRLRSKGISQVTLCGWCPDVLSLAPWTVLTRAHGPPNMQQAAARGLTQTLAAHPCGKTPTSNRGQPPGPTCQKEGGLQDGGPRTPRARSVVRVAQQLGLHTLACRSSGMACWCAPWPV